jgi:hypothetical protein
MSRACKMPNHSWRFWQGAGLGPPAALALAIALTIGCNDQLPPTLPDDGPASEAAGDAWQRIESLYQRAVEAGEKVPDDVAEWARQDLQRIGRWEYRIEKLPAVDDPALEAQLNRLGQERWECYWLRAEADGTTLFLKRPARSYLRSIPVSDLLRLLPISSE